MQRTGQTRKGTSAALSMWTLITGDKGLLGLGWPALGSRACPHHGHRPQHIPCVDCFLSLNPPCPGQDSDDSWVLHLSRSLWYFWGFQHVHHAHMFLGAGLHGVQTVAKDRAGQVGHACVLRIAERCGNMVFIKGSFCYNQRNPIKVTKQELSNSRHNHIVYYELLL